MITSLGRSDENLDRVNGRASLALSRSEQRYRVLSEATGQIVIVMDAAGAVVEPQEHWSDFTGQAFADVEDYGWANAIHPEETEDILRRFKGASKVPVPFRSEFRLRRKDGTYFTFSLSASPMISEKGIIE